MKKSFWIILSFVCALLILPVVIYTANFYNQPISEKTTDWGTFGDFLNPFIALINLIIFGYFSYKVFKLEENRDLANRPVLQTNYSIIEGQLIRNIIIFKNIGKSVAFEVLVTIQGERNEFIVRIGDIAEAGEEKLDLGPNKWVHCKVRYSDIVGSVFLNEFSNPDIIATLTEEELNVLFPKVTFWTKLKSSFSIK